MKDLLMIVGIYFTGMVITAFIVGKLDGESSDPDGVGAMVIFWPIVAAFAALVAILAGPFYIIRHSYRMGVKGHKK